MRRHFEQMQPGARTVVRATAVTEHVNAELRRAESHREISAKPVYLADDGEEVVEIRLHPCELG